MDDDEQRDEGERQAVPRLDADADVGLDGLYDRDAVEKSDRIDTPTHTRTPTHAHTQGPNDFYFTSPVSVIPNTYPFPDCHGAGCKGSLV